MGAGRIIEGAKTEGKANATLQASEPQGSDRKGFCAYLRGGKMLEFSGRVTFIRSYYPASYITYTWIRVTTIQTLQVPGYEVMQFLGSGARSTIWQVRERHSSNLFALKRVVKRQAADARFLQQAVNEHDVASHLDHPTIRRILRIRRTKKWLRVREIHLIMELCQGQNVQAERPKDITEVIRIFVQVGEALVHMNGRGYVQADMKPNNILVAPDGVVKIIDLGQSCPIGTIKERIQGTPDFIAPEQVHRQPLNARTDVYNFGAAVYWTLTGKPIPTVLPKKGGYNLVSDNSVSPPEELNPKVPASLSNLVTHCIRMNAANRPSSMTDVVSRLNVISASMSRVRGGQAPADL